MSVPSPVLGPCSAWIGGDDVASCCDAASNPALYDDVALEASMLLYELSGRLFSGLCETTVRPCRDTCRCGWAGSSWYWGLAPFVGGSSWGWGNECGDRCGCGYTPRIKLAGYPVREITEVLIDGEIVDPSTYRLDNWRWLTRMSDPGPPVVQRFWPQCQNMTLDDTEPGTWSVTYRYGVDPPPAAIPAAATLACLLYSSCAGEDCGLPAGAVRVVRQGIEIDRTLLLNFLDPSKPSGFPQIDTFLAAYSRGIRRRPSVYSPDVQNFPRPVGE